MLKFIVRKECFGGLVYDLERDSLYKINKEEFAWLERLWSSKVRIAKDELSTISSKLSNIGLIDRDGALQDLHFISNEVPYGVLSAPITVFVEVTRSCNLHCMHCFNESGRPLQKELSLHQISVLVNHLKDIGVFHVKITGGEPFLRPDIGAILDALERATMKFTIYTNGTLINDENFSRLQRYRFLKSVRVSIDGLEEVNDYLRGHGTFRKAMNTLKQLSQRRIPCELNFVINRLNYLQIRELAHYVEKEAPHCGVNLNFIKFSGRALALGEQLLFREDEMDGVIKAIKEQLKGQRAIKKYVLLDDLFLELFGDHFGCPGGQFTCVIDAQGNVFPCGLLSGYPQFKYGNIVEAPLHDIWLHHFDGFRTLTPNPQCATCPHFTKGCVGACRANAFNVGRGIEGMDPHCKLFITNFSEAFIENRGGK